MKGYGILYGGGANSLFGAFGAEAVVAIAENGVRMQQIARILCDTVPIRNVLVPYIDMLNLTEGEKSAFFSDRMIFETTDDRFREVYAKITSSDAWIDGGFSLRFIKEDEAKKLLSANRWTQKKMNVWGAVVKECGVDLSEKSVGVLKYDVIGARNAFLKPMERRAISRAELAFGEIAKREIESHGGKLVRCSDGWLIFYSSDICFDDVAGRAQKVFSDKMEAFIENNAVIPKVKKI